MSLFRREFKRLLKENKVDENLDGLFLLLDMEMIETQGRSLRDIGVEEFMEYAIELSAELTRELEQEEFDFNQLAETEKRINEREKTLDAILKADIPSINTQPEITISLDNPEIDIDELAKMLGLNGYVVEEVEEVIEEDIYMDFSEALLAMRQGFKVARKDWKGYWFIDDVEITDIMGVIAEDDGVEDYAIDDMIVARLANGKLAPAQPYQGDLLALDWIIID